MTWAKCIACGEMCGHPEQEELPTDMKKATRGQLIDKLIYERHDNEMLRAHRAELVWLRRRMQLADAALADDSGRSDVELLCWDQDNPRPGAST